MHGRFRKAYSRVENYVFLFYTRPKSDIYTFFKVAFHVGDKGRIFRALTVVHKTASRAVFRGDARHILILFESPYIVNHISARFEGGARHGGFVSIHGHGHGKFFFNPLYHGHYAPYLLFVADGGDIAGTGGFSAHVYYIRALFRKFARVFDRRVLSVPPAAVRKGIGRDVDYAHYIRLVFYVEILHIHMRPFFFSQ